MSAPSHALHRWTEAWAKKVSLPVLCEEKVTNTMESAQKQNFSSPYHLSLAAFQTQGKGRNGRSWVTHIPGSALLSTWSFEISQPPQPIFTPLLGLGLFRAVRQVWPSLEWSLKPPNDLYLKDKKVAGLLTEVQTQGSLAHVFVGLGFNVEDAPSSEPLAGYLCAPYGLGEYVSEEEWHQFLSALWSEWLDLIRQAHQTVLSPQQQMELLEALNYFPLKKEKYIDIQPNGTLVTESQMISWDQL